MFKNWIAWSLAALLLWPVAAAAQTPAPPNVQQIADLMVRLCIGGGSTQAVSGGGTGGADISLRSLDVKGNLAGQFNISKTSAEGLINGIDNALTQVAAQEADKVRDCLKPVRERILNVMLGEPPPVSSRVHATQRFKVCMGNGGGPSCANGVDAYYTCDEYNKIGGGAAKTEEILSKQFCEYTEDGKKQLSPYQFIHNYSVGGGQCGWTSFTVICNP